MKEKNRKKNGVQETSFFETPVEVKEAITFQEMNLSRPLLKAINAINFLHPTPIQAACIPIALAGRDICACAATGTGTFSLVLTSFN